MALTAGNNLLDVSSLSEAKRNLGLRTLTPSGRYDSAAIQADSDGGRGVLLGPGTFFLDQPVLLRTNDTFIVGAGPNTRIVAPPGVGVLCALGVVQGTTGVRIHDLAIVGSKTTEDYSTPGNTASTRLAQRGIVVGVKVTGSTLSLTPYAEAWDAYCRIERVLCTGNGTGALNSCFYIGHGNYSTVADCEIDAVWGTAAGFGYGVTVNGRGQTIRNCKFIQSIAAQGRHGIYAGDMATELTLAYNQVENFRDEGITSNMPAFTARDWKVIGNRIYNCNANNDAAGAATLDMVNVDGLLLADNDIDGGVSNGILATTCTRVRVRGNTVKGVSQHGMKLVSCNGVVDGGNHVVGAPGFVCFELYTSSNLLVQGNTAVSLDATPARSGFRKNLTAPVTDARVYDNDAIGTWTSAAYENLVSPALRL